MDFNEFMAVAMDEEKYAKDCLQLAMPGQDALYPIMHNERGYTC